MKKESNGIGENKNSKKINKNNKIISSILAVIMCCQSFVGAVGSDDRLVDSSKKTVETTKCEDNVKVSEDKSNVKENDKNENGDESKKDDTVDKSEELSSLAKTIAGISVLGVGILVIYDAISPRKAKPKKEEEEIKEEEEEEEIKKEEPKEEPKEEEEEEEPKEKPEIRQIEMCGKTRQTCNIGRLVDKKDPKGGYYENLGKSSRRGGRLYIFESSVAESMGIARALFFSPPSDIIREKIMGELENKYSKFVYELGEKQPSESTGKDYSNYVRCHAHDLLHEAGPDFRVTNIRVCVTERGDYLLISEELALALEKYRSEIDIHIY
ncbi:MAG: hypothetical protein CfP315_0071 [Candidatus Improbicoccus pseudotrichonymphae]|uniref:Uncharacterized protein n=1 Tax=Candidatus Improbicoccus pseudotrichonymphae TaxID=3033792 RepID=A0AA48KY77_9FIRM|nr:MAG: hypothetical protein CfP315_0071 [Candidatus Improbicoccus pseudotrichonymphae]